MELITQYGSVELDDINLDEYELSTEALEFIKHHVETAELFFAEEIDLTELEDIDNDIEKEIGETIIAEGKFDEPERAFGLAEYTDVKLIEIEKASYGDNTYTAGSAEYLVLTDDEAQDLAEEYAKTYFDGLDGESIMHSLEYHNFSDEFIDISWFDNAMEEYNQSYAEDIRSESEQEPYLNRLHQEMVDRGVLNEPEWPEEEDFNDFEREEFDQEEPDPEDFENEDDYSEAYDEWQQAESDHEEEQDRLEEEAEEAASEAYEEAKSEYESELENDIDNAMDEFVESLNNDYDNGLEYFKDHFGTSEVASIIESNNLADLEALGLQLLEDESRGYFLASYDGNEDYQTVTYKGEEYEFYYYRVG